jgi:transcriptional regulator with XRE-family HTH domain
MIKLSAYVRKIAHEKGLSASDIQKRARGKISFGYVNDIINERTTNPSVEKLQALALGLGVPEEDIFRVARRLPIESIANPLEAEIVEKFMRLRPGRRREALAYLDLLDALDAGIEIVDEEDLDDVEE